ncbi:MAG TPA: RodZ domain-containing protein [Terriglobia bacterium]|nr:RodZ domain-containing protein [Terriglobia bacterium]
MGELGERLRRERESRGISLQAIAQETRIGVRLLKAIEEEDFDQLPGGIFNKSFIEQYASYLGLDEKQAVRDYLRAYSPAREYQQSHAEAEKPAPAVAKQPRFILLAIGAAAVALIALLTWLVIRTSQPPAPASLAAVEPAVSPQATSASVPDLPAPSVIAPLAKPERILAPPPSPPGEISPEVAPESALPSPAMPAPSSATALLAQPANHAPLPGELPEELLLQINARSTVWISITTDGQQEWQGTLQPNQSRRVHATESIRLTVGNAGGVELTLNGKELGALGEEGEVKTVTLAKRALQETLP